MSYERECIDTAAHALEEQAKALREISKRGTYKIAEIQDIRRKVLNAVRFELDELMGHMPDKRHY